MRAELVARALVLLAAGAPAFALGVRTYERQRSPAVVEVRGRMAGEGGWEPGEIAVGVNEPLRLRLVSDDVVHGFGVGKTAVEAVDMYPGVPRNLTLTFDRAGIYTYYCTRWCGVNHWRMRGTIVVRGPGEHATADDVEPLHLALDLDLDAPHPAAAVPSATPDAGRGRHLGAALSLDYRDAGMLRTTPPAVLWGRLRADPDHRHRTDQDLWNLVAALWTAGTTDRVRWEGEQLYAANCAACHGERGDGRGVMARALAASLPPSADHERGRPAAFTDPQGMPGASSALLAGKILRGGMGTGMPNWGAILTDEQVWALVDYLWAFQFGRVGGAPSGSMETHRVGGGWPPQGGGDPPDPGPGVRQRAR
jgi:cytochrome c oxidase subunit 2